MNFIFKNDKLLKPYIKKYSTMEGENFYHKKSSSFDQSKYEGYSNLSPSEIGEKSPKPN